MKRKKDDSKERELAKIRRKGVERWLEGKPLVIDESELKKRGITVKDVKKALSEGGIPIIEE